MSLKADDYFPICVSCGRRGKRITWFNISESVRFGECLRCYAMRCGKDKRDDPKGSDQWDPPKKDP